MADEQRRYWQNRRDPYCGGVESGPNNIRKNHIPRHPPHLRGKEIGLYYAKLNRDRRIRENSRAAQNGNSKDAQAPQNGCGQLHKQRDYELPVIAFSGEMEKALHELASMTFPYSVRNLDKCDPDTSDLTHPVINFQKGQSNTVPLHHGRTNNFGLTQKKEIDRKLYHDFCARSSSSNLQIFRTKLPAYNVQGSILNALTASQVVVIMGETGCGKTTQVPQFILDSFISNGKGSLCKIVCTQPRRISAITVAERVAQERNVPCGRQSEVGYQIRLECQLPADQGSVLFCTTGIVLQFLQENPLLSGITHMIVDEVHERDLLGDFLLIILKDILKIRSDLKVILMSATLDQENISAYFGGCPVIKIPGFTYPVKVFMLEDVIETVGYLSTCHHPDKKKYWRMSKEQKQHKALESKEKLDYVYSLIGQYSPQTVSILESWNEEDIDLDLVVCLIEHICRYEKEGAVLVFLPGWEQISKLKTLMVNSTSISSSSIIIPLHSLMPTINQKEAFEKPPQGKRKIILATNIAETSITIDDVVFVIDTGKIKMQNFDHSHDIATLKPEWVAKSNAKQRRGRAGRTQSGVCFRLFTRFRESRLDDYQLPEMLRVRLEDVILKVKLLKLGVAQEFLQKALDPPSDAMVSKSIDLLKKLGALDKEESLTSLGYHIAQLPMPPQLGKMCILGAVFSCLDPVLSIVSNLSFREPFVIPLGQEKQVDKMKQQMAGATNSDHLLLCHIVKEYETAVSGGYATDFCYDHYLSKNTLKMLIGLKAQFAECLHKLNFISSCDPKNPDYNRNADNFAVLKAVICGGLYPNFAVLKIKKPHKFVPLKAMDNCNSSIQFHPKSVNSVPSDFASKLLVYFLKVKSSQSFFHDSTFVNYFPVVLFGHDVIVCDFYGFETICIDNWLHLKCSENTSVLIKTAYEKVKAFLRWKFANPNGCRESMLVTWERHFIECIIKLINLEGSAMSTESCL